MTIKEEYSHHSENDVTKDSFRKKRGRQSNSNINNQNSEKNQIVVTKVAFCDLHTPLDTVQQINVEDDIESGWFY